MEESKFKIDVKRTKVQNPRGMLNRLKNLESKISGIQKSMEEKAIATQNRLKSHDDKVEYVDLKNLDVRAVAPGKLKKDDEPVRTKTSKIKF
jgi:hypothetical protein